MTRKHFLLYVILLTAATSYAQTAVSPDTIAIQSDTLSDSIAKVSDTADTIAIQSDTSSNTIAIQSDTSSNTIAKLSDTVTKSSDTIAKQSDTLPNTIAKPSDTAAVIRGRYYGFGAGLTLGAIPLFSMWMKALPDSLRKINIPPSFGTDTSDNSNLVYTTIEAPEEFNFFIPLHISLYSVKENSVASVGLSFFYNVKQFQGEIVPSPDTSRRVNVYETMSFYSLALEASWQMKIPPEYFSLKGSQNTYVSIALGVSPAQYVTRYRDVNATANDKRMQSVADTVKEAMMPDFSANGASVSWRVGISSLKNLQNGNVLEMGLYYSGAYSGYFFRDGDEVMNSAIHKTDEDETDNPLSFMSNRIEFKVTYMIPTKREKKKEQKKSREQPDN